MNFFNSIRKWMVSCAAISTLAATNLYALGPDRTEIKSIGLESPIVVTDTDTETVVTLHSSSPLCLHSVLMTIDDASDSEQIFLNKVIIDGKFDTGIPFGLAINDTLINRFFFPSLPKDAEKITGPNNPDVHDLIRQRVAGYDEFFRVPANGSFELLSFMSGILLHFSSLAQSEAFALAGAVAQADAQAEAYADAMALAFAESEAQAEAIAAAAALAVSAAEAYAEAAALAVAAAEASADATAIALAEAAVAAAAEAVAIAEAISSAAAGASTEAAAGASSVAEAQAVGGISGEISQSKTSFSVSFGAAASASSSNESYINAATSAEAMAAASTGTFAMASTAIEAAIAAAAGAGATAEADAAAFALAAAEARAASVAIAAATATSAASAIASAFAGAFAFADATAIAIADAEAIAVALAIAEAQVTLYTTILGILEGPYCGEFSVSFSFTHFPEDGFTIDVKEIYTTADGANAVLEVNQPLPTEPLPIDIKTDTMSFR